MNGGYCFVCDDVEPYTDEIKKTEATVRGATFSYTEQIARCAQCGKEAYAECKDMNDILNQIGDEN